MKKLFGDNLVSKLRGIPTFVWVFFVYVSFFFANAYEFLLNGEYAALYTASAYAELGYSINTMTIGIVSSLLQPIVSVLLFEIILGITYNSIAGRYRARINRADYKFRARYLVILINLIVGILSIGYFFTQYVDGVLTPNISLFSGFNNAQNAENPYFTIQSNLLPFAVTAAFCVLFFDDFRKRFVPKQNQAALFSTFSMLFVGIYTLVFAFDLLSTFLFYEKVTLQAYQIAAYATKGGLLVLTGIAYFFYYRKLKKEKDDDSSIEFFPPEDHPSDSGSEKIYDDFDF